MTSIRESEDGEAYIPRSYVLLYPDDQAFDKRDITVRKFSTDTPFQYEQITQGLQSRQLRKGDAFGVIQVTKKQTDEDLRALCGLTGVKNFIMIDESDHLKRVGVKNTVVATLMVEFLPNQESGRLDLLVYGGPQGQKELWEMLRNNFGVHTDPIPLYLSMEGIRLLCEEFFEQLFEIVADPTQQDGYGNIIEANLKGNKREYILPSADRMQQIHQNKNIRIRSFRSIILNQSIISLRNRYDIRFRVLKDSGVKIEMPGLILKKRSDPNSYETVLYNFARYIYGQIVKDRNVYTENEEDIKIDSPLQLPLFTSGVNDV
jgi:hypothetical protein